MLRLPRAAASHFETMIRRFVQVCPTTSRSLPDGSVKHSYVLAARGGYDTIQDIDDDGPSDGAMVNDPTMLWWSDQKVAQEESATSVCSLQNLNTDSCGGLALRVSSC